MNDAYFFLGLFAFVFAIWLLTGGPSRPLSFAGPILTTTISSRNVSYSGNGGLPFTSQIKYSSPTKETRAQNLRDIASKIRQANNKVNSLSHKVSSAVAFGPPSPYRGTVYMNHYVSNPDSSNPAREYVVIHVSTNASKPVDISGWRLESGATGAAATIPLGTTIPRSGTINAVEPILLQPGDTAIVSSGRSPIGASFRENECTGYFAQFQSFHPSIPLICPTPNNELKKFYGPNYIRDSACIAYTQNLNRCTLVTTPPVNITSACAHFLTTYLNYNGCVDAHQYDTNFANTTWRVYLGRNKSMWRTRYEVVKLLDASGKTVDRFSY